METEQIKVKTLAIAAIAVLLIEFILRTTFMASSLFALGIARLIQALLMVWIVGAVQDGVASIGLERSGWFHGLRRGLLWSAAFGAAALCVFLLLTIAGLNVLPMIRTPLPDRVQSVVLYFLVGGIVAPIAEELFFRGLLYGFLRRWGVPFAAIFSTAIFTLAHPLRSLPLTQIAGGLLFALAYEAEGTLLVPVTIHVLGNLAIFALSSI
jgi:membrane protease YdiL (CAAX protease family)